MNTPLPLEPPQNALEALLKLRDYYAPLVEEYERLYTQSKDSLTHVEALLSNWPSVSYAEQESSTHQKQEKLLLFLNDESKNDDFEPNLLEPLKLDDSESQAEYADDDLTESPESPIFPLIKTRSDEKPDTALTPELPEPPVFPLIETSTQQPSLHGVEIPMLPQYQSLSRPEAIEQIQHLRLL
ncbi:hypothetical protein [Nostoc sp. MG11]|uniref:hypothetical protein n=1 Tax=Nostoc sp. MG11 TaxID=2721166 RepID=UPI001866706A|nr:hypothetical protein [Nostoc sp. MG11]